MSKDIKQYGPWALITGASSGIGSGFARELAAKGLNVVLVARRALSLKSLAKELEASGVKTRTVVQDLAEPGAAQAVFDAVSDLDVGLLVSNAGAGKMGGFLQNRVEDLSQMLRLNVIAHMELSHVFASRFRRDGRRGGILLVSSTAGLQPVPLGANYSSAKAFVTNFGESLNAELAELGIDVSVVIPGPTNTAALTERTDVDMNKLPMPTLTVEAVVRQGLKALVRRRPSHIVGTINRWMARLTPKRMGSWIFGKLFHMNTAPRLLPTAPIAQQTSTYAVRSAA